MKTQTAQQQFKQEDAMRKKMLLISQIFIHYLNITLLIFMGSWGLQAQNDPCQIGGYELSLAVNDVSCNGGNNGNATIASTGCECYASGCTFLWSDGQYFHTAENLSAGTYSVTVTHPDGCVLTSEVVVGQPELPIANIDVQRSSCSGGKDGSISLTPSNLAGPLDYEWSNGATTAAINDLTPGFYHVTITNFIGCQYEESIYVAANAQVNLISSIQTNNARCTGEASGSAQVIPIDNSATYFYKWSNGSTVAQPDNLIAGEHSVTVTNAAGCSEAKSFSIGEPNPASLSVNVEGTCTGQSNGSAIVTVSGGTPPYTYLWDDPTGCLEAKVNNLSLGEYYVTVTDSEGCTYISERVMVMQTSFTAAANSSNDYVCAGEAVLLNAFGGVSYQWTGAGEIENAQTAHPTVYPTETTTYQVAVVNAEGCTANAFVTVHINEAAPEPQILTNPTTICAGQSIQLIAIESSGSVFSWSPTESLSVANNNAPLATPSESTTYTVTATNSSGCSATASVTIDVEVCTGLADELLTNAVSVYPNPSSDFIQVQVNLLTNESIYINIYNTVGELLQSQNYRTGGGQAMIKQFAVNQYPQGLYYVEVATATSRNVQKFMVH